MAKPKDVETVRKGQQVRSRSASPLKFGLRKAKKLHFDVTTTSGAHKNLPDPGSIIGVSTVTGQPVTLAEGIAAARARVAADRLIPDAKTPESIVKLSEIELA